MKKRVVLILLGLMLTVTACGGQSGSASSTTSSTAAKTETTASSKAESPAESKAPEATPTEAAAPDPNDLPDDNPLKGIADPEEMRDVYDEIDDLMNDAYLNGPLATETDQDKIKEIEDGLPNQVARAHDLSYDR